jgi:hypothetical protein
MGDIGKIRFHTSGVIGKYSLNVGHTKTSMLAYRGLLLTSKLLNQGFFLVKLKSSIRKFYGRHHDLVDRYGLSVSQMTRICSMCISPSFPHSWLIIGFVTRLTQRVPLVEQELLTRPEHLSSSRFLVGFVLLDL